MISFTVLWKHLRKFQICIFGKYEDEPFKYLHENVKKRKNGIHETNKVVF